METSKFVKKKVEETTPFVPGKEKEAAEEGEGAVSSSGSCPA
jgi:hypothetical protein